MHLIYLIHEFHNLSWITEINELFHDILIYWDAPVYFTALVDNYFFQWENLAWRLLYTYCVCVCVCVCVYIYIQKIHDSILTHKLSIRFRLFWRIYLYCIDSIEIELNRKLVSQNWIMTFLSKPIPKIYIYIYIYIHTINKNFTSPILK